MGFPLIWSYPLVQTSSCLKWSPGGVCPLCTSLHWLLRKLWCRQGKGSGVILLSCTSLYANPTTQGACGHDRGHSHKLLMMKRWQRIDPFALNTLCWLLYWFIFKPTWKQSCLFKKPKFPLSIIYKCLFSCNHQKQTKVPLASHCLLFREKKDQK